MKKLSLTLSFFLLVYIAKAQFYKSVLPSPAFSDSLNRIVKDYCFNYHQIQGEPLEMQDQLEVYRSLASVPGAKETFIYRFHSVEDSTASWQAIMYKGESYKEAVKIYKNMFRLINKSKLHFGDDKNGSFSGSMQEPTEDLRFTSSLLRANSSNIMYKDFIANVDLLNTMEGWEVKISLNRKREDTEKY
ncbi:MAG: hypothetical protein WAT19_10505 [Ferruginibacter sp.]